LETSKPAREVWWWLLIAGLVTAAAVGRLVALGSPVFPVDDAYITLHNVRDLFAPEASPYPEATALHGATSAVHLALIALFSLVLPALWAQYVVGALAALAYALGLFRLGVVRGLSRPEAFLLSLLGLLVAETPHQLLNGLETGLALAAITWALVACVDPALSRRALLPFLCGLMPFIRPELAAVSGLLLLVWLHAAWRRGRLEGSGLPPGIGRGLGWLLLASVPLLLWYAVNTGAFVPSTVSAKKYFFAEGCMPWSARWRIFSTGLGGFLGLLGLLVPAALLLPSSRAGLAGLAFILALFGAYLQSFPGAVSHYEHRYLYVIVPFLLYALTSAWSARWRALRYAALGLLGLALLESLVKAPARFAAHEQRIAFTRVELGGVASWMRQNLPPGSRVLVHDAGYVTTDAPFQFIDLVGLKTPSNILVHEKVTWATCGEQMLSALEIITHTEKPDYFVVLKKWDNVYHFTEGLQALGWRLARVDASRGASAYEVYRLTPPS
jgi:hypothetical protein